MTHGFQQEALYWRNWLLRAIAGDPHDLQIMYGIAGERELHERVLSHLPGYNGSAPVRVGNGLSTNTKVTLWVKSWLRWQSSATKACMKTTSPGLSNETSFLS